MADRDSVITALRTIRIVTDTIRKQASGHSYRNRVLAVMRREMETILDQHQDIRHDDFLRHHTEVREQLRDGLQALATLLHDGGDGPFGSNSFETNREVNTRLSLLHDLATFLIGKAEEHLPADEKSMASWIDEGNLFIHMTASKSTITPDETPPDLWGSVLDALENSIDAPKSDDPDPDDLAF